MPDSVTGKITPRTLRGRDAAMLEVSSLLSDARAGVGLTLLVQGEAGIGKSRLTAEARAAAIDDGWEAITVEIHEQDQGRPNAVMASILRQLLAADLAGTVLALDEVATQLCQLVPEARIHFDAATATPPDELHDGSYFIRTCVDVAAASRDGRPRLIIVEDLHWADPGSLDFLLSLARQVTQIPALLWLTLRNDELSSTVSHFLSSIDRERLGRDLVLGRLDLRNVELMTRDLLGLTGPVRADFLHRLFTLSDGNPFFVEELLRSMGPTRAERGADVLDLEEVAIPRSIQDAVARRVATLDEATRSILQVASVLGTRFDFELLAAATELDEPRLIGHMKECISRQLIVEDADENFSFRHALTAHVVMSGLLRRERRELHRRVLLALLERPDPAVESVAYHAFEATEWGQALQFLKLAGQRALSLYAPGVAVLHFGRALEAAASIKSYPVADLYFDRASAFDVLSDFERARQDYERAIAEAERESNGHLAWQATLGLGLLWAARDYEMTLSYSSRAVELARTLNDENALARSLMRLGNAYSNAGDFDRAHQYITAANEHFQSLGDRQGEAEALDLLGMACVMGGRPADCARYYQAAIPLLESSGDQRTLTSTLASLGISAGTYQTDMLHPAMTLNEAIEFGRRALTLAQSTGIRQDEAYAHWQLGFCLGPSGRYSEALAHAHKALVIAEEIGHDQWMIAARIALGAILLDLGSYAEARSQLEQALAAARHLNSSLWIQQCLAFLGDCLAALRDFASAETVLNENPVTAPQDNMARVWHSSGAAAFAIATGRSAEAKSVLDWLSGFAGSDDGLEPMRVAWLRGRFLRQEGANDAAAASLEACARSADGHGHRSLEWRARAELAHVRLQAGDRQGARTEAETALGIVHDLAGGLDDEALVMTFVQQAALTLPPSLRRAVRQPRTLLTEREREVAALVTRGMNNRSIAEELVLSVRTVETHIENAIGKLGLSSRGQLAAWYTEHAVELGQG